MSAITKPITYQANLAKLPRALAPLIQRQQWVVWRWVQIGGRWTKPPFQARDPQRHASTSDPGTWSDFETALAVVQAGRAEGVTYVLTESDGLAALDLDHCRDTNTGSITIWGQLHLMRALHSYCEITPSGTGLRIWGTGTGDRLHRKFLLDTSPNAAVEIFRRTGKALTITGLDLRQGRTLGNLDKLLHWTQVYAERHKPEPKPTAAAALAGFDNGSGKYSLEQIEDAVRTGAILTGSRSETFHVCVGHLHGCGWSAEQIFAHMEQFPDGICEKFLAEGRLSSEIDRSIRRLAEYSGKPQLDVPAWTGPEADRLTRQQEPRNPLEPNLEEDPPWQEWPETKQPVPPQSPADDDEEALEDDDDDAPDEEPLDDDDDDELGEDDLEEDDEPLEDEPPPSKLPPAFVYGDPDPRPLTSWLVKDMIPTCGHGLLAGQWGTFKTFVAVELSGSAIHMQPFLGHLVKRQCGVAYFAAEGQTEIRKRTEGLMHTKYGNPAAVPFLWYETVPTLLRPKAIEQIVAMGRQAAAILQKRFGLPLGLIFIDTLAACAGYSIAGAENDPAVCQALMNVLKTASVQLNCFVFGIDHYGKNPGSGVRGGSPKEDWPDVVLACLGDRDQDGTVHNTRISVRKCRGGPAGYGSPFTVREVTLPKPDEEGGPVKTLVVDWQPGPAQPAAGNPATDPWQQSRRKDQRQGMLRLRRALMSTLAEHGKDLPIRPNGPVVRMVDQEIVRPEFYATTAEEGTPQQQAERKRKQFNRALDYAEEEALIGIREIECITYLWLSRPEPAENEEDAGEKED
jgi:AAA domain